jgi:DNA segregation ATPase FtsK/SpoIIIE, S-DNA-T family
VTVAAQAQKARPKGTLGRGRVSAQAPSADHKREIVALVLFGIAVFLVFVLVAGDVGGVVGRAVTTGLYFVFGRLAFLVPAAFIAAGVTMIIRARFWRSQQFAGVVVLLFGLFLFMAANVPPFEDHGEGLFVRSEFEARAGGLGEAFYALFHKIVGTAGVGIIAWIALLAGFSLMTGITAQLLGRKTKQAANVVRTTAERSTLATRRRDENVSAANETDLLGGGLSVAGFETAGTPAAKSSGVRLGPVDLVHDGASDSRGASHAAVCGSHGDPFEEWSDSRSAYGDQGTAPGLVDGRGGRTVVDGAQAFADIYEAGAAAGGGPPGTAAASAVGGTGGRNLGEPSAEGTVEGGDGEDVLGATQETLPGLAREPRQIELAVSEPAYLLPEPDMLRKSTPPAPGRGAGDRDVASVLLQALSQFGVEARVVGMVVGPRVTRYELQLAPGTKVGKVSSLKDDLVYAVATTEIRILTPIPGKSAVGVEVPNQRPDFVTLGDIYREFPKSAGPLMVWLGKDISGKAIYADLTKLPHLLIAGTTGSGKSGCVNCLVSSVLLRSTPEQVRLIMIDPKKVELSHYDRIPHLLVPVVTNMKDAAGVLHNVVKEMEDRYELMELDHARSLAEMNKTRARRGEKPVPYILIVIDELADLMMASPQEVEDYVIRLAQKSRAVGIHLVVATQRPSADVITGMIKANIPSRIAFAVSSQTDSRVILDVNGAETLLGMGDMLFKPLGSSHLQRIQGAYITEEEIALLVNHWRHQAEPQFREELLRRPADARKSDDDLFDPDSDDLLADAARLVIETGSASVSMLQRRLRVGYTRAGRLIDMLERRGIVGPYEGSKPRQILIEPEEFEHVLAALKADAPFGDMSVVD